MHISMNLTLKVKLATTPEQHAALLRTMEHFNAACDHIAAVAFENKCASKLRLQPIVYRDVREKFGLSAQMAIRAISKTCEAYKLDKTRQPHFKPHGAMVYDQRILGWKGLDKVSILTLDGRTLVPIVMYDYFKAKLDNRIRGQADLILLDNIFYLCAVVEVPDAEPVRVKGVLGIDLGIVNLAVDSDGETHSGAQVERVRGKTAKLRTALQSCGSPSAKRHLMRLGQYEQRFRRDTNHCISKKIVAKARDTACAVALEDLSGIRKRTTVRRAQRSRQSSWAFDQLRQFIAYKAQLNGVPVVLVDPKNTSRTCPQCGHIDKANRPTRDEFKCARCGNAGPADRIAACNIAARALVNAPIVSDCVFSEHVAQPPLQAHTLSGVGS
jgi:IS605 OrfB family transposase